ncbi:hypothetical protein SAMN04489765_3827 [Tsukamurella pulmonis]|uniref:Uncharacterized protein n=1 Tax=Tsukamurella pulmonis TaxID=47312 RepID=A0A1H1H5F2_9ACTN|nr:hypothetical protein [Tsukamurella pulmonis]SDR20601.1 hypothetical protein SAMN04489765_3827 [Tsukamurella pulmonis]SUP15914.1 Uncharacterised protein [Tsukamurella pulmonis]
MEDIGIAILVVVLVGLFVWGGIRGQKESKRRAALRPPVPTMEERIVERSRAITYEVFMPAVWPRVEEIHARPDVASMSDSQRTRITDGLMDYYTALMDETVTYRNWLWDAGRRDEATAPAPPAPPPPPEILAAAISAGRSAA